MAISCIISAIKRYIGQNSKIEVFIPQTHLHWKPALSGSPPLRHIAIVFGMEKLEWRGYPAAKKFENRFTCFDTVHERDRRTER